MKASEVLKQMEDGKVVKINGEILTYKEGSVGRPVKINTAAAIEESNITLNEFIQSVMDVNEDDIV